MFPMFLTVSGVFTNGDGEFSYSTKFRLKGEKEIAVAGIEQLLACLQPVTM